jgi:hypothetical protein
VPALEVRAVKTPPSECEPSDDPRSGEDAAPRCTRRRRESLRAAMTAKPRAVAGIGIHRRWMVCALPASLLCSIYFHCRILCSTSTVTTLCGLRVVHLAASRSTTINQRVGKLNSGESDVVLCRVKYTHAEGRGWPAERALRAMINTAHTSRCAHRSTSLKREKLHNGLTCQVQHNGTCITF